MADNPRNGVMLIVLGAGLAVMTHLRPQGLNVPPVIMDACLVTMTAGPAWIALGPGGRTCNAGTSAPLSAAVLSGRQKVQGVGCRIAFGFGGLILAGMAVAAVVMAVRTKPTGTI